METNPFFNRTAASTCLIMQESVRNDFNLLADLCLSQAEYFLKNQKGEFYPFGAYINKTGERIPVSGFEGDEFPLSDTVIRTLNSSFENRLLTGEIRAYAVAFDCRVTNKDFPNSIDAIATRMVHADTKDVFVYYFPYKLNSGEVEFLESFGEIASS